MESLNEAKEELLVFLDNKYESGDQLISELFESKRDAQERLEDVKRKVCPFFLSFPLPFEIRQRLQRFFICSCVSKKKKVILSELIGKRRLKAEDGDGRAD